MDCKTFLLECKNEGNLTFNLIYIPTKQPILYTDTQIFPLTILTPSRSLLHGPQRIRSGFDFFFVCVVHHIPSLFCNLFVTVIAFSLAIFVANNLMLVVGGRP